MSFLPCHSMYFFICFSFIPIVDEKYPTLQIPSFSRYISCMNLNLERRYLLDADFSFETVSERVTFGGTSIWRWMWSSSVFNVSIQSVGYFFTVAYSIFFNSSNTYGFSIFLLYFVHHTTWYWCWYVEWFKWRILMKSAYHARGLVVLSWSPALRSSEGALTLWMVRAGFRQ